MINSLDHTFIDYFIIDPTEKEVGQSMAILRTGYFKWSRVTIHDAPLLAPCTSVK